MQPMTERSIEIGDRPLTAQDVTAIARTAVSVRLGVSARARIARSHETLQRLAGGGTAIYGVNTGLGAAVDTKVAGEEQAVQRRIPLARAVGVGRRASREEVRAIIAARLARCATGHSGMSVTTVEALMALLNRGVHPVVPMSGSIGEADLAPLAHIACVLSGSGDAESAGEVTSAAMALQRAGLQPAMLGGKDGLALVSSNAASVGVAALVLVDAAQVLRALLAAAALSFEGYRANLGPLRPSATQLRPVPGQSEVCAALLSALENGDLARPGGARRLQDPLSFRCVGPVYGACFAALRAASDIVALELDSSDDNPAILAESNQSLPNANFDATHLSLTFEALGLAFARVAASCGERLMKLMSPSSSELPRFLSPIQEGRNGFATVQKTIASLAAEVQHRAAPMPVVIMPVADRVEDYATMALQVVEKTGEIVQRLRLLAAIELMVAAQACDLRSGVTLGSGSSKVLAAVRSVVARLHDDRPSTPDIEALDAIIRSGVFDSLFPLSLGPDT